MKQIEKLYENYSSGIFRYFYYLTYDVHKSNDLTQETFYQVILSIVKFKKNSKVSTWIYGIARNTYLKHLRKENREHTSPTEDMAGEACSPKYLPEEVVQKNETAKSIAMVLRKIPERYASILILRDRDGLSYRDIAEITRMSDSMVKVTLYRARKKFREEYTKMERR